MGPRKVRRFMDHTTQGKLDPNCFERLQSASGSDGFEWLNPETKTRVEQKKTHTEIHHSQAWVVLVKGISDMLQKKTRPVQDVRTALSKWICENKQQTLLGNTVVGKRKKMQTARTMHCMLIASELELMVEAQQAADQAV